MRKIPVLQYLVLFYFQNAAQLPEYDYETVRLFSVENCKGKEIYDGITNRNYTLTDTPGGDMWSSAQICQLGLSVCLFKYIPPKN